MVLLESLVENNPLHVAFELDHLQEVTEAVHFELEALVVFCLLHLNPFHPLLDFIHNLLNYLVIVPILNFVLKLQVLHFDLLDELSVNFEGLSVLERV